MKVSLGNVNLFVRDVARAQRFYTEALGLEPDAERSAPPSFALLRAGENCTITLQDGSTPGAALAPAESVELGFAVDDVEAARERLEKWGAQVSPVQQMGWGTAFDARDEDGHRLCVYRMRG